MNRIIILLALILIGLSAKADYTVTTQQPLYPNEIESYSSIQPYNQGYPQQYNQGYYQNPYQAQAQYANPYQAGFQQQYINPYQFQNPYGYRNNLSQAINPAILGNTTTGGAQQILKNIGQAIIYSKLRGY